MDGVGPDNIIAREAILGVDLLRDLVNRAPLDACLPLPLVLRHDHLHGLVSRIACNEQENMVGREHPRNTLRDLRHHTFIRE